MGGWNPYDGHPERLIETLRKFFDLFERSGLTSREVLNATFESVAQYDQFALVRTIFSHFPAALRDDLRGYVGEILDPGYRYRFFRIGCSLTGEARAAFTREMQAKMPRVAALFRECLEREGG